MPTFLLLQVEMVVVLLAGVMQQTVLVERLVALVAVVVMDLVVDLVGAGGGGFGPGTGGTFDSSVDRSGGSGGGGSWNQSINYTNGNWKMTHAQLSNVMGSSDSVKST